MNMLIVWLIAICIFAVLEAVTYQLVCVWFAIGAVAGFLTAYTGMGFNAQITMFFIVSIIALICLRPVSIKWMRKNKAKTNINAFIGKEIYVTKDIGIADNYGEGKLNGIVWSLKSENGETIRKGEKVTITGIEGVKLIVRKTILDKNNFKGE